LKLPRLSRVSEASRSRPASRKLQRLVSVSAQKVSCTSLVNPTETVIGFAIVYGCRLEIRPSVYPCISTIPTLSGSGITPAAQAILPVAIHLSVAWSVCSCFYLSSVDGCLSHSRTLLQAFEKISC